MSRGSETQQMVANLVAYSKKINFTSRTNRDVPIFLSCVAVWASALACQMEIDSIPLKTKYLYSICTMLDQQCRRWADTAQMLYKWFVFSGTKGEITRCQVLFVYNKTLHILIKIPTDTRRWLNVGTPSTTIDQHLLNLLCLPG